MGSMEPPLLMVKHCHILSVFNSCSLLGMKQHAIQLLQIALECVSEGVKSLKFSGGGCPLNSLAGLALAKPQRNHL